MIGPPRRLLTPQSGDLRYPTADQALVNVKRFSTLQDAFDEAHAEAIEAGSNTQAAVYIPPGFYDLSEEGPVVSPGADGVGVSVYGAGPGVSVIRVPDGGAGSAGIKQAHPVIGGAGFVVMSGFTILGPGENLGLGLWSTEMDGVEIPVGGRAYGVQSFDFRAAIVGYNDHWQVHDCKGGSSKYGLYFKAASPGSSNQTIMGCNFSGNHLASIGIDAQQYIGACTIQDTHLGFSPFAIYAEDAGDVEGQYFIVSSTMIDCGVESIGNGLFYDAGRNRAISDLVVIGSGISGVPDTNLRASNYPHDYGVVCGSIHGGGATNADAGAWLHAFMDLGAIDCDAMASVDLPGVDVNVLELLYPGSSRWVSSTVYLGGGGAGDTCRFHGSGTEGFLAKASGAIAKYHVVEADAAGTVKEHIAGSGGIIRGVAGAASTGAGDIIPVIDTGLAKVELDADKADNAPQYVTPSGVTNGIVTATGATAANAIGFARAISTSKVGIAEMRGLR